AAQGVHCLGAEHIVLAEPLGPDDFAVHQLSDGCAAAAPRRACGAAIGRTAWPSCSDRIASYGPATTESDSVSPLRISKCCAPAMPTSTGTNCALPFRTTETPSSSPCSSAARTAAACAAGSSCGRACVPG